MQSLRAIVVLHALKHLAKTPQPLFGCFGALGFKVKGLLRGVHRWDSLAVFNFTM